MTLFSFEVPIVHLKDFSSYQDFHLCLSHLCRQSKPYLNFYKEKVNESLKAVWLDNGYNENMKADSAYTLVKIAQMLHPHLIICPDSPKWPVSKIQAAFDRMVSLTSRAALQSILMVVVRDEKMMSYMQCHGVTKFAVSGRARTNFSSLGWTKGLHYLGVNTITELKDYFPISVDTSLPIKLALKGMTIRKFHESGLPCVHYERATGQVQKKKEYFNLHLSDKILELAISNIMALKKVCDNS